MAEHLHTIIWPKVVPEAALQGLALWTADDTLIGSALNRR